MSLSMLSSIPTVTRRAAFVVVCASSIAIAIGYILLRQSSLTGADHSAAIGTPIAESLASLGGRPGILFSSAAFDSTNGHLAIVPAGGADAERYRMAMRCERVHFAKGKGLCLSAKRGVFTTFAAQIFDSDFRVHHTLPLQGLPSRTRVSPDGRRGAITVFVSGDSYNSTGFSTRTTLIDMASGRVLGDLEGFAVTRDGSLFKAIDFNFWGVTFANDGNRFFATLGTGGKTYLVEGNADTRTARVLRDGVECPSLSPDNTRIVFKHRVSSSGWRLHILEVATLSAKPLAEGRNVDDQVEWLDDESIAYMLPNNSSGGSDVWRLSVNGYASPGLLISQAHSPAIAN
jgi:hypothetical protein